MSGGGIVREEVIGRARLLLGDCREILPSLRADACITDPPYGTGWVRGGGGVGEFSATHEKPAWDVFSVDWIPLVDAPYMAAFCAPPSHETTGEKRRRLIRELAALEEER